MTVKIVDTNLDYLSKFKGDWEEKLSQYSKDLTIFRSDQCLAKSVEEMGETAEKVYGIKPKIIELKSCEEAQNSPCAFGTTRILYNGKVVAETPNSNKRLTNIMNKELKG